MYTAGTACVMYCVYCSLDVMECPEMHNAYCIVLIESIKQIHNIL